MTTESRDLDPKEYVEILELLRKIDFFQDVPDEKLQSVLIVLQKQTFPAKRNVLFQGEIANRLFIIRKGGVTISTKNKGQKMMLAELTTPMYFGEISLLRPMSATATVTAGDDGADLLILSHDSVNQLSKKLPDIKTRIQTVIDARLASNQKARQVDDAQE